MYVHVGMCYGSLENSIKAGNEADAHVQHMWFQCFTQGPPIYWPRSNPRQFIWLFFFTSRAHTACPAGPIVNLQFSVCLSVRLSCHSLSSIDSRGTALVTQVHYRETSPIRALMAKKNRRLTTNKPRSENCTRVTVLCPISKPHDPVDSQSQLECISPPVGRPATCIVTP